MNNGVPHLHRQQRIDNACAIGRARRSTGAILAHDTPAKLGIDYGRLVDLPEYTRQGHQRERGAGFDARVALGALGDERDLINRARRAMEHR